MGLTAKQNLVHFLEFLKENGFLYMEGLAPQDLAALAPPAAPVPSRERPSVAAREPLRPAPAATPRPAAAPAPAPNLFAGPPLPLEERLARLEAARLRAEACRECILGAGRNKLVFFDGDPQARIVFVGEGPGADEDRQGLPFVGAAGQLLNKMIAAIGFKREEVFICNTVKCRPPHNRDPRPDEKAACEHFLLEQLALVRPQILVALGAHAAQTLCRSEETIGHLRGRWHDYYGIPLIATYHPSFLLRNESKDPARAREFRAKCWDDFQQIHARYTQLNPDDPRKLWSKKE